MKRRIVILAVLTAMFVFAGCSGHTDESAENQSANADSSAEEVSGAYAGMANPWADVSAEEIEELVGIGFGVPEGASDVIYLWNESDGIAEMRFTLDGILFYARAKKTDAPEDISGFYYDFSDTDNFGEGPDCYIRNNGQELRGDYHLCRSEEGDVSLGLWYYSCKKGAYSLSLGYITDLGFCGITDYAGEVFILE